MISRGNPDKMCIGMYLDMPVQTFLDLEFKSKVLHKHLFIFNVNYSIAALVMINTPMRTTHGILLTKPVYMPGSSSRCSLSFCQP